MGNLSRVRAAQLVSAFERRLDRDRCNLMASCDAVGGSDDQPAFAAVRSIAHRIVGSARIFGCDDLAEPAGDVERLVEEGATPEAIVRAVNTLADRIGITLAAGLPDPDWAG